MRAQPYERYPATCVRLLKWIRAFAETNTSDRLPSEENIAGQLGVSRVKIRDVLSQLEAAGYVTRKRGVGTLINRYVLAEAARLDIDSTYVDIVASCGYTPRATLRKLKLLSPASPILAEKLRIDPADGVYLFEKVVYADERPVIVVEDYIPAPLYDQSNCDLALMDTNIYFSSKACVTSCCRPRQSILTPACPLGIWPRAWMSRRISPLSRSAPCSTPNPLRRSYTPRSTITQSSSHFPFKNAF